MLKFNPNGLPLVIIQIMLIFPAVKAEIVKWSILLPPPYLTKVLAHHEWDIQVLQP